MATVFCNILNLAGINACILFKEQQQQETRRKVLQQLAELRAEYMEGKGAAAGGTRCAAVEPTTATAADMEMEAVPVQKSCKKNQTEPNIRHLKCHKPVCGNCEESGGNLQTVTRDHNSSLFVFVLDQLVSSFSIIIIFYVYY